MENNKEYYQIYGYDSNFDWGGSHVHPLLCTVRADNEAQAQAYAETLPRYKDSWHGAGYIKKITVVDLTQDTASI